jgi:ferric-dicitrate binding protein FerR (iron transport regulator)
MNEDYFKSDSFLARWAASELSEEEREQFELWLADHPEEKVFFEDSRFIWRETSLLRLPETPADREWEKVQQRIRASAPAMRPVSVLKRPWAYAAAAAVMIGLIGSYAWWDRNEWVAVRVPPGKREERVLPDGSKVALNSKTVLEYEIRHWSRRREVKLEGEALFDVLSSDSPFRVHSRGVVTSVLGTSFNVRSRSERVEVTCVHGSVQVSNRQSTLRIPAGNRATLTRDSVMAGVHPVQTDRYVGWVKGRMYFERTAISDVFRELETAFDVRIDASSVPPLSFTGFVSGGDVHQALNEVCLAAGLLVRTVSDSSFAIQPSRAFP